MNRNKMLEKKLPPGKSGLPFIGEGLSQLLDQNFKSKKILHYGPIFRTNTFGTPTIIVSGTEAIKIILQTNSEYLTSQGGWPATFEELLGESLFIQDGEKHRRNRRLLMPAFHKVALINYFQTMLDLSNSYLNQWVLLGYFPLFSEVKKLTFDVASNLMLGNNISENTEQLSQWFSDLTNGFFTVPVSWSFLPYGKAIKARNNLWFFRRKYA